MPSFPVLRRLAAVLSLFVALLPAPLASREAAAEVPACGGRDLIARIAAEDAPAHARMLREAAEVKNGEGLLWKVETGGAAPSYLFGTIHVTDDRVIALPETVEAALASVATVAVESVEALDPADFARNIETYKPFFTYRDGKGLAEHLDLGQRAAAEQALGALGVRLEAAGAMKPWMLATALSVPACETARRKEKPVVDQVIARAARERGLALVGLERTEEQLAAFDAIRADLQVEYLISTARLAPRISDLFHTLAELYLQRRTGLIQALSRYLGEKTGISEEGYLAFNDNLIDRRNATMLERALPLAEKGGALIAVGALHLPGEKGLVELFRARGFTVTRVD